MNWNRRPVFRWWIGLAVALVLCGLLLGLWAFWWEPSSLVIVRQSISIPNWRPEQSGLRVALLSDLHVGSLYQSPENLQRIVDRCNGERPDLVLLLGDYVIQDVAGGRFVSPEQIALVLQGLRAPLGVYAVLGNHDWWFDGRRVRDAMERRGIHVLENESAVIRYGERTFALAGIGDFRTGHSQVAAALAKIGENEPVLAITHNPDVFPEIPGRVALTLAGHTHGGQVDLPLFGRLIVPSRYGERYAHGLVEEGGKLLFVTSGIGTSMLPVRFRVPPELVILTLHSAGGEER